MDTKTKQAVFRWVSVLLVLIYLIVLAGDSIILFSKGFGFFAVATLILCSALVSSVIKLVLIAMGRMYMAIYSRDELVREEMFKELLEATPSAKKYFVTCYADGVIKEVDVKF